MPGKCAYCGTQLKRGKGKTKSPRGASLDHLIPRAALRFSKLTLTDQERSINKLPCCIACNSKKADMDPREWLAHIHDPRLRTNVETILQSLPVSLIYQGTRK